MKQFFSVHYSKKFFEQGKVMLYLSVVSLVLLWPSFRNGYPLVFSDTGTYIFSAFSLELPSDRPIGYGYFIRLFSGGVSLWFVIYAQAFLAVYLLWKFLQIFFAGQRFKIHFFTIVFLAVFTALPWFTSQLMPDIFPGLIFLLLAVFIFGKPGRTETVFFALLFFFFLITHSANFLLSLGFLLITFLFIYFKKSFAQNRKTYLQRIILSGVVTLCAPLFFLFGNYQQGYGFVLNPSSYAFIMSRVNDAGILDSFLKENCDNDQYVLCAYQGHLVRGDGFLWNQDSPLNIGGSWERLKPEFEKILRKVFAQPRFIGQFAADSFYRSVRLFFMSGLDPYLPYGETGPVHKQLEKFFPHELLNSTNTRQFRSELNEIGALAFIFTFMVWLSVVLISWIFHKKIFHALERFVVYEIFLYLVLNAMIMGTLSGAFGRYQERLVWLLPLICFVFFIKKYYSANFLAENTK